MRRHLLALGLSLTTSLAQASPATPAQIDAHRAVLQARLVQHRELVDLLAKPSVVEPALTTMLHFSDAVKGTAGVVLKVHSGDRIVASHDGLSIVEHTGVTRKATPEDLGRAGITGKQVYAELVIARLHELSGTTPGPRSRTVALDTLTAQRDQARQLDAAVRAHPDAALLRAHHDKVVAPHVAAGGDFQIAGMPGAGGLAINAQGTFIADPSGSRPHTYLDLLRLGIRSVLDYETLLAKHMTRVADVAGDPRHPDTITAARTKLADEVATAQAVEGLLATGHIVSSLSPDLALLREIRETRGEDPRTVIIAARGAQKLAVVHNTYGKQSVDELMVIDAPPHPPRSMTLADARTFGIRTLSDIQATISQALLDIAPEDLPAVY